MSEKTIDELAIEEFEAKIVLDGMRMMNVSGLAYEYQKQTAIDYARAKAKHWQCETALNKKIREEVIP